MKSQIPNPKSQIISKFQFFKQYWNFDHWILKFIWKLKIGNWKFSGQGGQLLVEAILAIALLGVLAGIVGMAVNVSTQSNKASGKKTVAIALAQEAIEAVRAIRDNNETTGRGWNRIYIPSDGKGEAKHYYSQIVSNKWQLTFGEETVQKDGVDYTRYLYIEDICRDAKNGGGNIDTSTVAPCNDVTNFDDPSTVKVTVKVTASGISGIILEEYLTRAKNEAKVWDTDDNDNPNTGVGFKSTGAACSNTKVMGTGSAADVELGSGGC